MNFGITFTLCTIQRVIDWRDSYVPVFEVYVNLILIITYDNYKFPEYFQDKSVHKKGVHMIWTCTDLSNCSHKKSTGK